MATSAHNLEDFPIERPVRTVKRDVPNLRNPAVSEEYRRQRAVINASSENRLAAVIADPGTWSIAGGFRGFAINRFGVAPADAANLGELAQPLLDSFEAAIKADRSLFWKVYQRGFWVHGVDNLRDYLRSAELFTMEGRAELITCPVLLTMAEHDVIAATTPSFFDALRCPKTMLRFSASEGAGDHCEIMNRSLLNRRVLDWLDELFAR